MRRTFPAIPALPFLLLAAALCGCAMSRLVLGPNGLAVGKSKMPRRISDRITREEGNWSGTLKYAGDELKLSKQDEKSLMFRQHLGDRDPNLSPYAGRKTKRLYFKNRAGSQVHLMKTHMMHGSWEGEPTEVLIHDIRCILKD